MYAYVGFGAEVRGGCAGGSEAETRAVGRLGDKAPLSPGVFQGADAAADPVDGRGKSRSKFPEGMTERKATARAEGDPPALAKDDKRLGARVGGLEDYFAGVGGGADFRGAAVVEDDFGGWSVHDDAGGGIGEAGDVDARVGGEGSGENVERDVDGGGTVVADGDGD